MSAPRKRPTRGERQKESDKQARRFARSPCDRPPETPINLFGEFDRFGGGRHKKTRAKLRWREVHEDTSGFNISIHHYQVDWEYSATDTPGTWFDAERYMVPPKDEDEPEGDTRAHFVVKELSGRLAYRWRVRAIARGGCKSAWSPYYQLGDPGGENPPAPLNVEIYDGSLDRVVVDWEAVEDGTNNDTLDLRVKHYACEISKQQNFSTIYKKDIVVGGTQRTFKVRTADLGSQFFGRAWAVGPDETKSAKVPGKIGGNNDPFALADGVTVDSPSQNKIPSGTIHKWPGPLAKIPAGWLHCNGASYSTTVYAELFAAIGYRYGGSGPNFNVPDFRGRKPHGARTGELEGDADDGYGTALAESQREDNHARHPRHKHKHHHRNRRRDHDETAGYNTGTQSGGHTHGLGPFNAPLSGPSGGGIDNIPAGGVRSAAGPAHNHDISGQTSQDGSGHTHTAGGSAAQGSRARQQYGTGVPSPVTGLIPAHGDHTDQYVFPDGPNTLFDDSMLGGSRGVDSWDGGETDSFGAFTSVDEDAVVFAQGKGHKRHPHIKVHFIIKT